MTNNVISMMVMRKRCGRIEGEDEGLEKRYKDLHGRLNGIMERIIQEHEEERKVRREMGVGGGGDCARDLIEILLDISEDEKAAMKLTTMNIKAFVQDIFAAGTDTSAITSEWALAELINHPNIFKKAREEIDAVVGKERLVEESDIPNLPCIQAIIKETLRLHPTAPLIIRKSSDHCKISGYDIPSDTRVFINVWAIGRVPHHWDDPLEFRPERFMPSDKGDSSQIDIRGQHFHFLPFGSGRRACPGITLAMQVVQTTIAAMVHSFEWNIASEDGGGNICVDMTEGTAGITVPRAKPLVCFPIASIRPLLMDTTFE
ncbi:hypothetical protein AAC387_Pa03g3964 [Persea americana]